MFETVVNHYCKFRSESWGLFADPLVRFWFYFKFCFLFGYWLQFVWGGWFFINDADFFLKRKIINLEKVA